MQTSIAGSPNALVRFHFKLSGLREKTRLKYNALTIPLSFPTEM
jgi:hypothetical protein